MASGPPGSFPPPPPPAGPFGGSPPPPSPGFARPYPSSDAPYPYAGFGRRLLAFVIDAALLAAIHVALGLVFGRAGAVAAFAFPAGLGLIVTITYFTWCWSGRSPLSAGQTVGNRVMSVRVAHPDGSAPRFGTALARALVLYAEFLICLVGAVVSFITVLGSERKQALHDMIAGTVVLRS